MEQGGESFDPKCKVKILDGLERAVSCEVSCLGWYAVRSMQSIQRSVHEVISQISWLGVSTEHDQVSAVFEKNPSGEGFSRFHRGTDCGRSFTDFSKRHSVTDSRGQHVDFLGGARSTLRWESSGLMAVYLRDTNVCSDWTQESVSYGDPGTRQCGNTVLGKHEHESAVHVIRGRGHSSPAGGSRGISSGLAMVKHPPWGDLRSKSLVIGGHEIRRRPKHPLKYSSSVHITNRHLRGLTIE